MAPSSPPDFRRLVRSLARDEFVRRFPCRFLLCTGRMEEVSGPGVTHGMPKTDGGALLDAPAGGGALLAVRKTRDHFPSMITVGRTVNNDVVLPDATVSRFHAYFRVRRDGLELQDGGSRNGTWIDDRRLPSRISGGIVPPGARLRFGQVLLRFLEAEALWDQLRERVLPQAD